MPPEAPEPMVRQFVAKAEKDLLAATILADFGVAPRYPGWEPEAGAVSSKEALAMARAAMELLRPFTEP